MSQQEYISYLEKLSVICLDPNDIESSVANNMQKWIGFFSKVGCAESKYVAKEQQSMDFLNSNAFEPKLKENV